MTSTVTIVLDGEFGERIKALDAAGLWLLDSATNLDALQFIRRENPSFRPTTFHDSPSLSVAEQLVELLPTIELHHGQWSQDPPFDRLEVYGARPNQSVQAALSAIGFILEGPTPDGFAAIRAPAG